MTIKNIIEHKNYASFMFFLVLLYALLLIPNEDIAKKIQVIYILGCFPAFFYYRHSIFKDPIFKLLGIAIVVSVLSWINSMIYLPDIANSTPKIDRLGKLFGFIFIAYWLKGSLCKVYLLWGAFVFGFVIGCFLYPDFFNQVNRAIAGARVDFGVKNAQFTAMFSAVSILIVVFIGSEVLSNRSPMITMSKKNKIFFSIIAFSLLIFLSFIVIITQARQVWLAIFIIVMLFPLFYAWVYKRSTKKLMFISYVLIGVFFIGLSQTNIIQKRVLSETSVLQKIFSGDLKHIPMTSIGIRFNSWMVAVDWIGERPLLGSGPAAIPEVIKQSNLFTGGLKRFGHLHNYHLEVLVAYGIFGLVFIYVLYYWLVRSLFITQRLHPEIAGFTLFSLMFVVFWACINSFESFNGRTFGVYTHNIMFAGFYTFYLTSQMREKKRHENRCHC